MMRRTRLPLPLWVIHGTDLEYGAVALGNIGGGNNAFVKIQAQNGDETFDHGAFYTGNNGGGLFFALSGAVPSPAILDVFFCGTTATMRITSAAGVQTYTNDYGTRSAMAAASEHTVRSDLITMSAVRVAVEMLWRCGGGRGSSL